MEPTQMVQPEGFSTATDADAIRASIEARDTVINQTQEDVGAEGLLEEGAGLGVSNDTIH